MLLLLLWRLPLGCALSSRLPLVKAAEELPGVGCSRAGRAHCSKPQVVVYAVCLWRKWAPSSLIHFVSLSWYNVSLADCVSVPRTVQGRSVPKIPRGRDVNPSGLSMDLSVSLSRPAPHPQRQRRPRLTAMRNRTYKCRQASNMCLVFLGRKKPK